MPQGETGSLPLVIDLHDRGQDILTRLRTSGWADLAASGKVPDFGILWPAAVLESVVGDGAVWNDGLTQSIWGTPDDVGFLLRLVEMAPRIYHQVDASRIYLTGRGDGCQLALNFLDTPRPPGDIADSGSKLVSGVACMGAYGGRGGGASYSAVPVLMIHGTNKEAFPYRGMWYGLVADSAEDNIQRWADANECSGRPETSWIVQVRVARRTPPPPQPPQPPFPPPQLPRIHPARLPAAACQRDALRRMRDEESGRAHHRAGGG